MDKLDRLEWLLGKRIDLELDGKLLSLVQAKEIAMLSDQVTKAELLTLYGTASYNKLEEHDNTSTN